MKTINSPHAPSALGPYSHAVEANGFLFVSGQLPINPGSNQIPEDIGAQTRQVMENLLAIIEQAGGSAASIVKTTIFLTNMDDFAQVNEVYGTFFKDSFPARATVGVNSLARGAKVEIDAIAALPA